MPTTIIIKPDTLAALERYTVNSCTGRTEVNYLGELDAIFYGRFATRDANDHANRRNADLPKPLSIPWQDVQDGDWIEVKGIGAGRRKGNDLLWLDGSRNTSGYGPSSPIVRIFKTVTFE